MDPLRESSLLSAIALAPFGDGQAETVAALCTAARPRGLSLAARACLAVAFAEEARRSPPMVHGCGRLAFTFAPYGD